MTRARLEVLDSWRGIAALMVALRQLEANGAFFHAPIVRNSYLFVDFFFVLSGFVIAHAYGAKLTGGASAISFTIRRFGRLWPLHMALLALFVLYEFAKLVLHAKGFAGTTPPFTGTQSASSIVPNMLLVQGLGIYDHLTWNMPSWSISTEFWTYLLFAAVVLTMRRWLVAVSLALVFVGLAVVAAYSPDYMNATNDYGFFRCVAGFFVGVLTHRIWVSPRWSPIAAKLGKSWPELAALVLVGVFVSSARYSVWSLLAPFVFAIVVLVYAHERGVVSKLLTTRPFQAIGAWSYSIYMVHLFVVLMIERVVNHSQRSLGRDLWREIPYYQGGTVKVIDFGPAGAMDILAVAYVSAVLVFSWVTYRTIEDPTRRWFNALADRWERSSGAGARHDAGPTGPSTPRPRIEVA